ncbi:MAG: hypothetical protein IAE80_05835 [Anaerolinea sp.]|nr:hypothetical protein [Anaerolinea sp.]
MPSSQKTKVKREALQGEAYQRLVQQISERVWQLWIVELRRDQERRGRRRGM